MLNEFQILVRNFSMVEIGVVVKLGCFVFNELNYEETMLFVR